MLVDHIWTIVGSNIALAVVAIGSTISLFLWSRSEANTDRRIFAQLLTEIQKEMKEVHGRISKLEP
jgi:HAMP domain-containing protein